MNPNTDPKTNTPLPLENLGVPSAENPAAKGKSKPLKPTGSLVDAPGKIKVQCNRCGRDLFRFKSEIHKRVFCPDCRCEDVQVRFWRMVEKSTEPNGCWIFKGCTTPDGYGRFTVGKENYAHRVAWVFLKGKIPDGAYLLHKCPVKHNPACVNPDHLYVGNQSQNMLDAVAQGTHYSAPGEENFNALLNESAIKEIRETYGYGKAKGLAKKFGVKVSCIRDAAIGKSWQHLNEKYPPVVKKNKRKGE